MATLGALECLVAIADSGSITQAARLLRSSRPAVSHQLAVLEQETRTPLFHCERRGVKLVVAHSYRRFTGIVADAQRRGAALGPHPHHQVGGDPGNVTPFGQSAGAILIAALLATPEADGLVHRAISQSGGAHVFTPEQAARVTTALAAKLGGAPHCAELPLVFGPGPLHDAWVRFATSGDPGWAPHPATRQFSVTAREPGRPGGTEVAASVERVDPVTAPRAAADGAGRW
jgi:Bacterial regulatory helix-turn-helix protein, lysR family/Carboxylesterase family